MLWCKVLFLIVCLWYVFGCWIDKCVYVFVLSTSAVVVLLLFSIIQHPCCFPLLLPDSVWFGYDIGIG